MEILAIIFAVIGWLFSLGLAFFIGASFQASQYAKAKIENIEAMKGLFNHVWNTFKPDNKDKTNDAPLDYGLAVRGNSDCDVDFQKERQEYIANRNREFSENGIRTNAKKAS